MIETVRRIPEVKPKEYYLSLRHQYLPERIKLVIVAESPPKTGKYFYDPEGRLSEPLLAAMMKQLNYCPQTKQDGLAEFKQRGWVLVDATYEPVDQDNNYSRRNRVIDRDYQELRSDLDSLTPDRSTQLILIKANVCRLLELRLKEDGFNVLNHGGVVYFPSNGRQTEFHQQFAAIRRSARI